MSAGRAVALVAVALGAGLFSGWIRRASAARVAAAPDEGGAAAWFVTDPDSLYHMRRLERALAEGGVVAGRDPLLAFPEHEGEGGAPIPWPSGYTRALLALAGDRAPGEPLDRERWVEHEVARWPMLFAALTSGGAALVAGAFAGPADFAPS